MKKFLHIAGGTAKKAFYTVVKLARKLASMALRAAGGALTAAGMALKKPLHRAQALISPVFRITMIVSGALAALSCVGWLLTRKKTV